MKRLYLRGFEADALRRVTSAGEGYFTYNCSVCDAEIPVPYVVALDDVTDDTLAIEADLADAWAHQWRHDGYG